MDLLTLRMSCLTHNLKTKKEKVLLKNMMRCVNNNIFVVFVFKSLINALKIFVVF